MKKETTGEVTILISNIFFALTAVLVKLIPDNFSGAYTSFFRFAFGIILIVFSILITKSSFKIYEKKYFILRGIFGALSMTLYFFAIKYTSSGRATLLINTFPIFVASTGVLFFKEKVSLNSIISIIICITGVVFVFYDGSSYPMTGDLLAIAGAFSGGFAIQFLKKMRENNNVLIVYLSACIFGLFLTAFSIPESRYLNFTSLMLLIAVSTAAFLSQIFMGHGFKYISSTKGSIITFSKIPIAIIFSYFIVGEEIKIKFIVGTLLIIAGLAINRK